MYLHRWRQLRWDVFARWWITGHQKREWYWTVNCGEKVIHVVATPYWLWRIISTGINQNIQYLYIPIFIHFICECINQWNTCALIISKGFEWMLIVWYTRNNTLFIVKKWYFTLPTPLKSLIMRPFVNSKWRNLIYAKFICWPWYIHRAFVITCSGICVVLRSNR